MLKKPATPNTATNILDSARDTAEAIDRGAVKAAPELCPCDNHAQGSLPPAPAASHSQPQSTLIGINDAPLVITPDALSALITESAAETVVAIEQGIVGISPEICPCPDHLSGVATGKTGEHSTAGSAPENGPLDRQSPLSPDAIASMITASATETVAAIDSGRISSSPEICPCPDHAGTVSAGTVSAGTVAARNTTTTAEAPSSDISNNRALSQGDDKTNQRSESKGGPMGGDSGQAFETRGNGARQVEGSPESAVGVNRGKLSGSIAVESSSPTGPQGGIGRPGNQASQVNRKHSTDPALNAKEQGGASPSLKARVSESSQQQRLGRHRGPSNIDSGHELISSRPRANSSPASVGHGRVASTAVVPRNTMTRGVDKATGGRMGVGQEHRVAPGTQRAGRGALLQSGSQPRPSADRVSRLRSTIGIAGARQPRRELMRVLRQAHQLDRASTGSISLRNAAAVLNRLEKSPLYKTLLVRSKGLRELLREARHTIKAAQRTRDNVRLSQSFRRSLAPLLKRMALRLKAKVRRARAKEATTSSRVKLRHNAAVKLARGVSRQGLDRARAIGGPGIKRLPVRIRVRAVADRAAASKGRAVGRGEVKQVKRASAAIQQRSSRTRVRTAIQRRSLSRRNAGSDTGELRTSRSVPSRLRRQRETHPSIDGRSRRARILRVKKVDDKMRRQAEIRQTALLGLNKLRSSSARKLKGAPDVEVARASRIRRKRRRLYDESIEDQALQDFGGLLGLEPQQSVVEPEQKAATQEQAEPHAEDQIRMFVSASNDGPKGELSTVQAKELDSFDEMPDDDAGASRYAVVETQEDSRPSAFDS